VIAGHGRTWSSAALHGHGGDGDVKCRYTLARIVTTMGQGGRGGGGEAMGEVDWVVVLRGWRASMVEVRRQRGGAPLRFSECERGRARARE